MRESDDNLERRKRERFETMAVRLANHLQMSMADSYDHLPPLVRSHFESLRYCDIIKPLIIRDNANGQTVRQLAIKYGLSPTAIQNHLERNRPCQ